MADDRAWVATRKGLFELRRRSGAWTTRDDGLSWQNTSSGMRADFMPPEQAADPNIQDPHRIVRCAGAPERLWCQHHCGIWASRDGAAQWDAVAEVPVSAFGFTVTVHRRDPDTAWFVPAVADDGRTLLMGSTTGGLWASADAGERWQTVSLNLPPIAALRFDRA